MNVKSESEVAQSCPTPSDPMDCSLPGSSVHGIFQARVLEWGAIAFSARLSEQGSKSLWVDPLAPPEMPGTGWSEEVWDLHRPFRGRVVKAGDGCSLRTCPCAVWSP